MNPKLLFRLALSTILTMLFLPAQAKTWQESSGNDVYYYYECDNVIDGIAYRLDDDNLKATVTFFSKKTHLKNRLYDHSMGFDYYITDFEYDHNYGDLQYRGNVVIPEEVEFEGHTYTVTSIDTHAFDGCKGITDIRFPQSVYYNFAYWKGDTKEDWGYVMNQNTVKQSSYSWGKLYIRISESDDCDKTYFKDPFPWLLDQPAGTVIYQGDGAATVVTQEWYETDSKRDGRKTVCVDAVQIKEGTKSIMCRAAFNLLASRIVMPESVGQIDHRAFQQANVDTIIMEGVKEIGDSAFFEAQMKSVSMPNVEEIGKRAFSNSGITELSNTPFLKSVGPTAFCDCDALTSITIPPLLTTINSGTFANSDALTSVTIPSWVTSVGPSAFVNCTALKTVTILSPSLQLPFWVFAGTGMENLTMPVSITDIHQYTFQSSNSLSNLTLTGNGSWNMNSLGELSLSQLKTINIGGGVTSLGDCGFSPDVVNCYADTPPACSSGTFTKYNGDLHVPTEAVGSYFTAPVWENFGNLRNDLSDEVTISQAEAYMLKGDELQLTAVTVPEAEVMWLSSDPAVATVDASGKVTATGIGECDIFASLADNLAVYAWCHIDAHIPATITLPTEELIACLNTIVTLTPMFDPEPTEIVATSSDPSVAIARIINAPSNGAAHAPVAGTKIFQVLGVKEGVATITVASTDGISVPATLEVTVIDHFPEGDVNCDRAVNGADVTALYNALMGESAGPADMPAIYTTHLDGTPVLDGDVNGDGVVSGADVTALYNLLLGQ